MNLKNIQLIFKNNQVIKWKIEFLIKTAKDKEFTLKNTVLNIFKTYKKKRKNQHILLNFWKKN